jgi:hypothetical protein
MMLWAALTGLALTSPDLAAIADSADSVTSMLVWKVDAAPASVGPSLRTVGTATAPDGARLVWGWQLLAGQRLWVVYEDLRRRVEVTRALPGAVTGVARVDGTWIVI